MQLFDIESPSGSDRSVELEQLSEKETEKEEKRTNQSFDSTIGPERPLSECAYHLFRAWDHVFIGTRVYDKAVHHRSCTMKWGREPLMVGVDDARPRTRGVRHSTN